MIDSSENFTGRSILDSLGGSEKQYGHLIESANASSSAAPYSQLWWNKDLATERIIGDETVTVAEYLGLKLRGYPLVDLGSGDKVKGIIYSKFVEPFGPSEYICVNKYFSEDLVRSFEDDRIKLIKSDLLAFISSMPDESTNFVLCGIDKLILPNAEYHRALAQELAKKTLPQGIVLGTSSEALVRLDQSGQFRKVFSGNHLERFSFLDTMIFEKR